MKKRIVALLISGAMIASMIPAAFAYAGETEGNAAAETEAESASKSAYLLAEGYE